MKAPLHKLVRALVFALLLLVALALASQAAPALAKPASTAEQAEVIRAVAATATCMRGAVTAAQQVGATDPELITEFVATTCGLALFNLMTQRLGWSEDEAGKVIVNLARRQVRAQLRPSL